MNQQKTRRNTFAPWEDELIRSQWPDIAGVARRLGRRYTVVYKRARGPLALTPASGLPHKKLMAPWQKMLVRELYGTDTRLLRRLLPDVSKYAIQQYVQLLGIKAPPKGLPELHVRIIRELYPTDKTLVYRLLDGYMTRHDIHQHAWRMGLTKKQSPRLASQPSAPAAAPVQAVLFPEEETPTFEPAPKGQAPPAVESESWIQKPRMPRKAGKRSVKSRREPAGKSWDEERLERDRRDWERLQEIERMLEKEGAEGLPHGTDPVALAAEYRRLVSRLSSFAVEDRYRVEAHTYNPVTL